MTRRPDGRTADALRPVAIRRKFTGAAPGSVLIEMGRTKVLCTASVEHAVPPWLENSGKGWLTAEYGMLPGSTVDRKPRKAQDGRGTEIQRIIGRSLRAAIDLELLGERTIWVDCDVLEADGGTRTAAITGAYVALVDAVRFLKEEGVPLAADPIRTAVAAVSVGLVDGTPWLDLCYKEDVGAQVDFNVVMTAQGKLVEVQGTAEHGTFERATLGKLLDLAEGGVRRLLAAQEEALGAAV